MEARTAKVISYLFHPVLMPSLCVLILLYADSYISFVITPKGKSMILLMVFILTYLIPSIIILFLIKRNIIKNIEMHNIQDRTLAYLIVACIYFSSYYMLKSFGLPAILHNIMLGATLSVIIILLVSLKWKISAHLAGIGGLTGMIIGIFQQLSVNMDMLVMASVFLAGLLGFSRLKLNSHTPSQVYAGFFLGLIVMLVITTLL